MSKQFDFYFDFSSPYGYFAAMRIDALAAKYQRTVRWMPILLGVMFKVSGSMPLTMIPLKGDYSRHDFDRTARFHDIRFNMPSTFPIATQSAARAVIWLQQTAGDAKAITFAKAAYQAYFAEGIDISDSANLLKIATELGINAAELEEGLNSAPIKHQLKMNVEQAIERKVFGSPFIIVDDEPFWGFDRFDQLETFLKNGTI
ncbi:MAG TPA: 2-hydroxychromene-2-carboxylate isomerase [Burkholderiaceae bacterium]|nr:2-hydroxychromene-2-carboxylate isomerase [Burkholderiaceae bacterium]